ncbi:MAG: RloB family protein [Methylocella sp.]
MARRRQVPDLRRRISKISPKRKFILYCEGKKTEPDYFGALQNVCDGTLIKIEAIGAVGVPRTIADRSIERAMLHKRSGKKEANSFERLDEVWAVFDRDEHPDFDQAVNRCREHGVGVARSNPCFEVWLILHFEDFQCPDGRHAVQKYLKKICPDYDPDNGKTINCLDAVKNVGEAEVRAECQLRKRKEEGLEFSAPSTTVFELTRAIRTANVRKV